MQPFLLLAQYISEGSQSVKEIEITSLGVHKLHRHGRVTTDRSRWEKGAGSCKKRDEAFMK
jgi:hypothetical protein